MNIDMFLENTSLGAVESVSDAARRHHEQLLAALADRPVEVRAYKTMHGCTRQGEPGSCAIVAAVSYAGLEVFCVDIVAERWRHRQLAYHDDLAELRSPASARVYFGCIAKLVAPFLRDSTALGVCLPYPLERVNGTTVVRPPRASRLAERVDGADAEAELREALSTLGVSVDRTIGVINSSVATLMAGSMLPHVLPDNSAALTAEGLGMVSYFERGLENNARMAVTVCVDHLEDIWEPGREYVADSDWARPTIGNVTLALAKKACDEGCFTSRNARTLRSIRSLSTESLCTWLEQRRPEPTSDALVMEKLGMLVIHKFSQRLAACAASVLRRVGRHAPNACHFLLLNGNAFTDSRLLRNNLIEELDAIERRYRVCKCRLAQVDQCVIVGTAFAVTRKAPFDIQRKLQEGHPSAPTRPEERSKASVTHYA